MTKFKSRQSVEIIMKNKPSVVVVNGIEFKTSSDAAKFYSIPKNIITEAIRIEEISAEDAINRYLDRKKELEVTIFDQTFRSRRQACIFHDLRPSSVNGRMKRKDESVEQAIKYLLSTKPEKHTVFEKEFLSLRQVAIHHGVSEMALRNRVKIEGKTPEEAIIVIRYNQTKNQIKIDGKTYNSLVEVANEYGIKVGTLYSRMRKQGLDVESAINKPLFRERSEYITQVGYFGVVYAITNAHSGMKYVGSTTDIKKRKRQHFSVDLKHSKKPLYQAMRKHGVENFDFEILGSFKSLKSMLDKEEYLIRTKKTRFPNGYNLTNGGESGHHKTAVTINRKFYPTAREACIALDLSYESTQQYKRIHKLSWQKAILQKIEKKIFIDGRKFKSISAVCKFYKLSQDTVKKRMDQGLTLKEAISQPHYIREVTINGIRHRSIATACKELELKESSVRYRIREHKESPEQAILHFLNLR